MQQSFKDMQKKLQECKEYMFFAQKSFHTFFENCMESTDISLDEKIQLYLDNIHYMEDHKEYLVDNIYELREKFPLVTEYIKNFSHCSDDIFHVRDVFMSSICKHILTNDKCKNKKLLFEEILKHYKITGFIRAWCE